MSASQAISKESPASKTKIDWLNLPPVPYVLKHIIQRDHKAHDLAVAVVIADMMGPECRGPSEEELQVCFPSLDKIAVRAGCSVSSVRRSLKTLCDGDFPLFARRKGGRTRGYYHESYEFQLVRNPAAFAKARDKDRIQTIVKGNFRQGGGGTRVKPGGGFLSGNGGVSL